MHFARHGEDNSQPFRSERFCSENGQWYFHTREGALDGPYRDRADAQRGLAIFLARTVLALPELQRNAVQKAAGVQDGVQALVQEVLGFLRSRSEVGDVAALAWANNRIAQLGKDQKIERRQARIDILNHVIDLDHDQTHGFR